MLYSFHPEFISDGTRYKLGPSVVHLTLNRLARKTSKFGFVDNCAFIALPGIPVVPISSTLIDTIIQPAFYPPEIRREISSLWANTFISSLTFKSLVLAEL